ncbi:MAG: DUF4255 domain-containing protein [Verrucomicrobia bacterium]|nr:MAG: DUF4255 domain-containing protein [Verrucomicrobiota bacterium]
MSNAFAVAGVTAALQRLLRERLAAADAATSALPANFVVSAEAPDRITQDNGAASRLNLFLYEVAPNTGWATQGQPIRDFNGERVSNPPLALDLFYLLSAYGVADLDAEILLGHAMQVFHEHPGLSRENLNALLDPTENESAAGSPKNFRKQAVLLAGQVETVKVAPVYKRPDDMSKIWSSLQSHYRASVVYQVSVVLIESRRAARTPLPVLTRGVNDRGPAVQPVLLAPLPTLLAALPPGRQPAVNAGGKLKLFGHHLRGTGLKVTFTHARLDLQLTMQGTTGNNPPLVVRAPDPADADAGERTQIPPDADACVVVDLSQAVGNLAAGWYSVALSLRPDGDSQTRTTNSIAVALAPQFVTSGTGAPVVTSLGAGKYRVKLNCAPPLQVGQPVTLLLGQNELLPPQPLATAAPTVSFEGALPGAGDYLARLRVDGVDSLFIQRPATGPPVFDATQLIHVT